MRFYLIKRRSDGLRTFNYGRRNLAVGGITPHQIVHAAIMVSKNRIRMCKLIRSL